MTFELLSEPRAQERSASLTLVQALPKGRKMDLIVEKATEFGAAAVWPVETERIVVRPTGAWRREHVERWQRIAGSAAAQCGLDWVPEIREVSPLADVLPLCGTFDAVLIGCLGGQVPSLHSVLGGLKARECRRLALLIGPEGDLAEREIGDVVGAGGLPVSFGPLVFRVETAALYGLSVLAYEFLNPA